MNIAERICDKYKIDYNLTLTFLPSGIDLTYGEDFPLDLMDRVEQTVGKMGIYVAPGEIPVCLEKEAEGKYKMTMDGHVLYRFADKPAHYPFPDYDPADAIGWTLYAIAAGKEQQWMVDVLGKQARGQYVTCRCFSARQQSSAARIMASLKAQDRSDVPEEKVEEGVRLVLGYVRSYTDAVPLFSGRPIEESAFRELRGRQQEMELGQLANRLFGHADFQEDLDSYVNRLQKEESYHQRIQSASEDLQAMIYDLPWKAVRFFLDQISSKIDEYAIYSPSQIQQLLRKRVRFSLHGEKLSACFAEVDDAWEKNAVNMIRRDFLRSVIAHLSSSIQRSLIQVQRVSTGLQRHLRGFFFAREDSFGQVQEKLNWKQLSEITDRDLYSPDLSWEVESLLDMQRTFQATAGAQRWLCTERLKNLVVDASKVDQFNTTAVPLLDERYVFGLWLTETVD